METKYEWKTTLLSSKFEIYRNGIQSGELNKGNWKRKVTASLNNRKILFDTQGLFRRDTSIIDMGTEAVVGTIKYTSWTSKASIEYNSRTYNWHFDNFFRSKWSIGNEAGSIIKFSSGAFSGTINSYTGDEILILTGFFIRNILRQRSAGIAAAT
jgi:hypothetical protein